MVQRIKLLRDTWMPLEGQWQIVLSGSVVDAPDAWNASTTGPLANAQILSPGESAGSLKNAAHAVPVRDVKQRK